MDTINTKFYSKILLLGEYSLIRGSCGIAINCSQFFGDFKYAECHSKIDSRLRLDDFCHYLKNSGILSKILNLKEFEKDISNGLYFDSNIPLGHGVGSSGALCAAVYSRYSDFKRKDYYSDEELSELKDLMALMESFYHGTSSGIDCLISLINRPLIINDRSSIEVIETPNLKELGSFYLLETHIERKTSPLVHNFLNKLDDDDYFAKEVDKLATLTNSCVNYFLKSDVQSFFDCFYQISKLQYLIFSDIIPNSVKNIWLDGLETKDYLIKLCGAGGGGFFLVYSRDNNVFSSNDLILLE